MYSPVLPNFAYLAAAIAHAPLFVGYVRINAGKGHYQFFPLLVAVALWLILDHTHFLGNKRESKKGVWNWLSSSHTAHHEKSANGMAILIFLLASIVLGTAAIVQSSFLVIPSVMIFAASWIISRYGFRGFKLALPAWLLLLIAIPFPWNLDAILVHRMQFLASGLASLMLDSVGQIHFREGLTLITPRQQFFAEEACSGIRSLFSSIAAISVYGVFHRLSPGRHVFNWLQVIVWVIVCNAIRIAIVVFVAENWTQSIASGPPHEMLGIGVFAAIVLIALSTSVALDKLREDEDPIADTDIEELEIEAHVVKKNQGANAVWQKFCNAAAVCFFALVLAFCIRLALVSNTLAFANFTQQDVVSVEESVLPKSIEGWKVVEFEKKTRPQNSPLAPNSCMWSLINDAGNEKVVISLDSPYHEFHDLYGCYGGRGWDVRAQYDVPHSGDSYTCLQMSKRREHGIVFFSAYDNQGKSITRSETVSRTSNAWKNLSMVLGMSNRENISQRLPVTQIQLIHESRRAISDSKRTELLKLFEQACMHLKASVYSNSGGSANSGGNANSDRNAKSGGNVTSVDSGMEFNE
jgi:exosortase